MTEQRREAFAAFVESLPIGVAMSRAELCGGFDRFLAGRGCFLLRPSAQTIHKWITAHPEIRTLPRGARGSHWFERVGSLRVAAWACRGVGVDRLPRRDRSFLPIRRGQCRAEDVPERAPATAQPR